MTALIPHDTFNDTGFTDTTATSEGGRFTVLTARRQGEFLKHLQLFGNVRLAARAAGVSAQTVYRARRASRGFALAWDAALLAARSYAEATLADRALSGTEEIVFYHGEEVARRQRYDSRLLLAHLARLDRMEERADLAAALPLLDQCVAALGRGEDIDACLTRLGAAEERAAEGAAQGAQKDRQEGVPPVPSRRNGKGESAGGAAGNAVGDVTGADAVEEAGEDGPQEGLEARLTAMEAARPEGAATPRELACRSGGAGDQGGGDPGAIEAAQLAAFEAGADAWWLVTDEGAAWEPGGGAGAGSGCDDVDLDTGMAAADHAQAARGGAGEIDGAPAHEGSAIVDAHGDRAPVGRVGDAHESAEGQRLVGGCHGVHVEPLAIGGEPPVKAPSVEGGDAGAKAAQDTRPGGRLDRLDVDSAGSGRGDGRGRAERGEGIVEGGVEGGVKGVLEGINDGVLGGIFDGGRADRGRPGGAIGKGGACGRDRG